MTSQRKGTIYGVLLIAMMACAAFYIGDIKVIKALSLSPLIVGIILGMLYANTLRMRVPTTWIPGVQFCAKRVLRVGIIFYGFRLTFADVTAVGPIAIGYDALIVVSTIVLGMLVGRVLRMDRATAVLTSVGSAICGAAAVLGAEGSIGTKPYKTAVAVSTVVIFGTLSMFLYPVLYRMGLFQLTPEAMGLFTGGTVHEVAHVVGAGNAMGKAVSDPAIIVKMIRVMMLVPVLLVLAWVAVRKPFEPKEGKATSTKVNVPWFAILFLVMIGVNSMQIISAEVVEYVNTADTFLLTMAMTALGAETSFDKFKAAGAKPFVLASVLYVWLIGGGYLLVKLLT